MVSLLHWSNRLSTVLMVFESTVVYQRIRSMSELRKMAPKAYPINVYRGGAWISVPTSALLPGDICSLCTLGLLKRRAR